MTLLAPVRVFGIDYRVASLCLGLLAAGAAFPVQGANAPSSLPVAARPSTLPPPLKPPTDARTLQAFVERCQRERVSYQLSLKQLAADCERAKDRGRLPYDLQHVHGFTWFFGYVIDRANEDVIFLGLKDRQLGPGLDVDCLVTAMKAAYGGQRPGCSLDADSDPKRQKSRIEGIDWNSRWAQVMLEADYDMKRIGQGILKPAVPGVTSYLDLRVRSMQQGASGGGQTLHRFWFDRPRQEVSRTLILDRDGDLVLLFQNPVVLAAHRQDPRTNKDTDEPAQGEALQFANSFSRNMIPLGRQYRSIGELLSLYRLLDLMVHLKQVGRVAPPSMDYWLQQYQSPFPGPPRSYPTLTQTRTWKDSKIVHTYKVSGGVKMPVSLDPKTFQTQPAAPGLKDRILNQRY